MSDTLPPLPEPIIKESCPDGDYEGYTQDQMREYALAARQQAQVPDLQGIEQYRMQMAGISTAALGYWKEGDGIHPDYDTVPLRDVAKLYAKYDALFKQKEQAQAPVHAPVHGWTDADADAARLALELECLLTDRDVPMPVASRWWESAHEALALHRQRLESERAAVFVLPNVEVSR